MQFSDLKAALEGMSRKQANAFADVAGVPHSTVAKIRKGHTEQPRISTVELLYEALRATKKPRGKK